MCGRYAITLPPEAARAFFAFAETPNFPPRYNIAPTQPIPVVLAEPRSAGMKRHFQLMRWGFLPGFVKDPETFPLSSTPAPRPWPRGRAFAPPSSGAAAWRSPTASIIGARTRPAAGAPAR